VIWNRFNGLFERPEKLLKQLGPIEARSNTSMN